MAEYSRENIAVQTERELLGLYDSVGEGCVECGLCQKDCRFLQKYGSPKEIALKQSQDPEVLQTGFECNLCWLCTAVCPKKIDPAAMFLAMRRQANIAGYVKYDKQGGLLRYERWGASSFISWYGLPEGCDTVFFPGCAMAGSRSQRVIDLFDHLKQSIPSLGMVLDCCTKPSHDLGRQEYFSTMFTALRDALVENGVKQVLVACPSCYRVWSDYGGPVKVRSIYEQLSETGPLETLSAPVEVTVHDPCPTRYDPAIHQGVRKLLAAMGFSFTEMKHHGNKTICCGEGGAACYVAPDFAGNWTTTRAQEAEGTYMATYCAGCTHFLGKFSSVGHVADLFFEPEKTLMGKVRISRSPFTWFKRILLKQRLKKNVVAKVTGNRRGADGSVVLGRKGDKGSGKGLTDRDRKNMLEQMYLEAKKSFADVPEITPEESLHLHNSGKSIFVDVRSEEEQNISILPGALTEKELFADPASFMEKQVIVYCTIGYRSGKFVKKHGSEFPGMKNLRGGILGWLHAGGKVTFEGREVQRVHVYGAKWALQPPIYSAVVKKK